MSAALPVEGAWDRVWKPNRTRRSYVALAAASTGSSWATILAVETK